MLIPVFPLPVSVVGAKRMIWKKCHKARIDGERLQQCAQVKFSDPVNSVAFSVCLSEQRCRQ